MRLLTPNQKFTAVDSKMNPIYGGRVRVVTAGTENECPTYHDEAMTIRNTNPVILNEHGQADIFYDNRSVDIYISDHAGVLGAIWTNVGPFQ